MRLMGIDYGTKRVGVALTDEGGSMAFPYTVLENNATLRTEIESIVEQEDVAAVVVGQSLNRENEENPVQAAIQEFIQDLTLATGLPVYLEPEQYTTQEALRVQGRNESTDASAAALILNSYLTKQKHGQSTD